MLTSLILGNEVELNQTKYLVVRIVSSSTLFETPEGKLYIVEENYGELRSVRNEVEFLSISETLREATFTKQNPNIKALPELPWRRNAKVPSIRSASVSGSDNNNGVVGEKS